MIGMAGGHTGLMQRYVPDAWYPLFTLTTTRVRVDGQMSSGMSSGMRQDCNVAPDLFNTWNGLGSGAYSWQSHERRCDWSELVH